MGLDLILGLGLFVLAQNLYPIMLKIVDHVVDECRQLSKLALHEIPWSKLYLAEPQSRRALN